MPTDRRLRRNLKTIGLASFVLISLIAAEPSSAEIKTITATGEYRMGDNDTRTARVSLIGDSDGEMICYLLLAPRWQTAPAVEPQLVGAHQQTLQRQRKSPEQTHVRPVSAAARRTESGWPPT